MLTRVLVIAAVAAAPALAQGAAGGGAQGSDAGTPEDLRKELERALRADQVPPPDAPPVAPPPVSPLLRGFQSLNPDLSVIVDGVAGYQRRPPSLLSGDDPDLAGDPEKRAAGFALQELEIAFSAVVDPYFKAEAYLTIPNLKGLEVEEAFITTTSLPWNLQVKAGSFRSIFGRQNGQHLHMQDFTRRPLINAAFLGADGLRGAGAQVSWLAPFPFFLTFYAEAYSLRAGVPVAGETPPVASFGADGSTDPTFVGAIKTFFPFGDDWSVYGGVSAAKGNSPGAFLASGNVGMARGTVLFGGDLYVKWKPPNVAAHYNSVTWQTEAVFRHFAEGDALPDEWDGGFYSQLVFQVSRRLFLGVRGELVGIPASSVLSRTMRFGAMATVQLSEFSRIRLYGDWERANLGSGATVYPANYVFDPVRPSDGPAAFLQFEVSIGAHGAHPY